MVLCETWLTDSYQLDDVIVNELLPEGYLIERADRKSGQTGGGLAIVYRENLKFQFNRKMSFTQFECIYGVLNIHNTSINICGFYRPPPSERNGLTTSKFIDEWHDFISEQSVSNAECILVGDINIHIDNTNSCYTQKFNQSLGATGFQQHILEPTHCLGHTLDVLIGRDDSALIENVSVIDIGLCDNNGVIVNDHFALTLEINKQCEEPRHKTVSYRKLRDINIDNFKRDIKNSVNLNSTDGDVDDLTTNYVDGLKILVDAHAPLIQKTVVPRPNAAWFTEDVRRAKRLRRKHERTWRHSKKDSDRQLFKQQCAKVAQSIFTAKSTYYSSKVMDCKNNMKALTQITDKLLKSNHKTSLPTVADPCELPSKFQEFFETKIDKIRKNFDTVLLSNPHTNVASLKVFEKATASEVRKVIMNSPNKSCEIDSIPTWLLKECIDELLPLITTLINRSLSTGKFPEHFKEAIIRPLLKKPNSDIDELKNYRPVSNLNFISKIIEKIVMARIECHLIRNNLHEPTQSAYKKNHSTETALLKISNDIIQSLDVKHCTILASLDLSAAFDTVDHKVFLHKLYNEFGIEDEALNWFRSYLDNRKHRVSINGISSDSHKLKCGVPQGSVLGARMYTMYTRQLSHIILRHGLQHHSYADDTQIYIQCENNAEARSEAMAKLEHCISDICIWMKANALKLNEDKTECIIFSTDKDPVYMTLQAGTQTVKSQDTVKVLGVMLDSKMTLNQQISSISRSVHMHIRKIKRIRMYLSDFALKTLIQSTVTVRLDYCNSLYYGLSLKSIKKLQLAQNAAARLIAKISMRDPITNVLRELHWLPVTKRCQYKLLVLTYKTLHGTTPTYICDMLNWYHPARPLRSGAFPSLVPNKHNTITLGRRLCDSATAVLWNNLPRDLRCQQSLQIFKKHLKTHLF